MKWAAELSRSPGQVLPESPAQAEVVVLIETAVV